jgi:spore maturation protein CgeB
MSGFFFKLRNVLKQLTLVTNLNSAWKARQLKAKLRRLRLHYYEKAVAQDIKYWEDITLESVRTSLQRKINISPSKPRRLKVFWVGANLDQDRSGFLQALERLCDVTHFYNFKGEYGLWYKDRHGRIPIYDPEIVALNDKALLNQVESTNNMTGIDILMGQMWSNYVSVEALARIRAIGIPVINISMDDRLPDNWGSRDGYRLGAVGLIGATDLVLTTTAEACLWYAVEGCPAIFWPLASDPGMFSPVENTKRDINVLFVGNRYGIRSRIVDYLVNHGIEVSSWGGGWPNGYVNAKQCAGLFKRARIILGIGTVGYCDDVYTLKLRDFDAPMAGALYVTHRNPDLTALYREGEEIACYENEKECVDVIRHYLSNPELLSSVARAGWCKAISRDSWDRRIAQTFEKVGLIMVK